MFLKPGDQQTQPLVVEGWPYLEKYNDILAMSVLLLQMISVWYLVALVPRHASDYRCSAAHLHCILCSHRKKSRHVSKEDGMVCLAVPLVCLITEPRYQDCHAFLCFLY